MGTCGSGRTAILCAILFLTELLFVYRNNTARAQLQNIAKIIAVIVISLMPFFINNYLLFGNIFFPAMTDVTLTGTTNVTAPVSAHGTEKIVRIVESTSKIPALFGVLLGRSHVLPVNLLPFLFHNYNTTLMSIFEVCPLLYFAFSFLHRYNVLDKLEEITTALTSCMVILTPALIVGVCVFGSITGNNDFYTLCIMCEIMAWIAITFLAVSFGFLALRRSERSKDMFAYAIGFSIFSTFFWLFSIGFMR